MKEGKSLFDREISYFSSGETEEMSLQEYLDLCHRDPSAYASPAERLLKAIGEPRSIDTSQDPKLGRIFSNRVIRIYESFEHFYGLEDEIDQIVSFFKHAAQGLEEKKQILYLLGPVGGGKSSIAEKLKSLMENEPFYAIKDSPIHESPLALFNSPESKKQIQESYDIPARYLKHVLSPWAIKRLNEFNGDITQLRVVKLKPSKMNQIAITKTEPSDENNQDISSLVGKVDIHKLEDYSQDDPDAYSFSGALCRANRGLMEFVEMFKAPIKVLHPLLTATQEMNYNPTEGLSSIPFDGIILAHSNESEWQTFKNNRNNEAFLDRVYIIKIPYCLRVTEEVKIYEKLIQNSSLSTAPCAPKTLEMMAQFSVLTRLKEPENSNVFTKMRVYDGENLKDIEPKTRSYQEYRDMAGVDESMTGLSTRFAYKILSKVFNYDHDEIAANPIYLLHVLEKQLEQEQYPTDLTDRYLSYIKEYLMPRYIEFIGQEIQTAYLESYSQFGQNIFDRYVTYSDYWVQDQSYRDPETGELMNRDTLNQALENIEKPAGISNPKDFRHEIVNFILRAKAANGEHNPDWRSYEKLKVVIEKKIFANTEEVLPVINFEEGGTEEDRKKHDAFMKRMLEKGYTKKQVRLLSDWYLRVRKSS